MNLILLTKIHRVLSYNQWANTRLIDNITLVSESDYTKQLPVPFGNIHGLLQHLNYYEAKYYYKIVENVLEPSIEKQIPKALLVESILDYSKKWLTWMAELIDNPKAIDQVENNAEKIIDLNTHSSYHRGQINTIIAMLGYKPVSLDVFLYNDSIK